MDYLAINMDYMLTFRLLLNIIFTLLNWILKSNGRA
jgi:hypothetical protein